EDCARQLDSAFGFAPQPGFSELGVLWGGVGKVGLFQCLWVKLHLICATNGVPLSYEYSLSKHLSEYAVFCGIYRARSSRRNSREVAVSNAARAHSSTVRTARVMMEETNTATGMSARHTTATTNLGTLTLPSSRSLKALCPRR